MELLNFLNSNENWKELLAAKPYCVEVKQDRDYFMLKYNMIESDFMRQEVREARGSIFRQSADGKWICVCRAMDKFGNWGEPYADTAKIDWSQSVSVQEKIDGSIIKLWCDRGLWHTSTNGTIDAFKAECGDSTYGDVFYSIVQKYTTIRNFFSLLDPRYTYWFEIVHPQYNTIVVHYKEAAIYFLGCRNMVTMEEENCNFILNCGEKMNFNYSDISPKNNPSIAISFSNSNENCKEKIGILNPKLYPSWLRQPKQFHFNNLDDVLRACHNMGEDEEGYVVCAYNQMENDSFLRIKCKGDEYLRRHKLRGNGPLTSARIVEMWQEDSLDDFLAYFPEHKDFVSGISFSIQRLIEITDLAYAGLKSYPDRKDFAFRAKSYIRPITSYCFARLNNKISCAREYYKNMKAKNVVEAISILNSK